MWEVSIYIHTLGNIRPSTGYWSYVLETIVNEKEETKHDFGEESNATLHVLHMMALFRALERLKKPCHVTVYTDSNYIAGIINDNLLDVWEDNDWRNSKGKPVKHMEIWKEIWKKSMEHEIGAMVVEKHPYKSWQQRELKKFAKEMKGVDFPQ